MKQLFVILIGALFMGSSINVNAQKGEPHLVRKNADRSIVYTQAELADSLNQNGVYYQSLRNEMFKAIKIGYDKKGKVFPVTNFNNPDNVNFVFDHTKYVEKGEFEDKIQNGYKIGNSADNYVTVQKKEGYYGVFEYDGVSVRFIDPNCGNVQKEFGSKPFVPASTDTSYTYVAENGQPTTIVFSPNITLTGGNATATVSGSGNSTNTNEVALEGGEQPQSGRIISAPVDPVYEYRHPQRGGFRQREYQQQRSYTRVNFGIRVNVRGNQQQPAYNPPPQQVQRRSMGGGRGDGNSNTNMGNGRGTTRRTMTNMGPGRG